MAVYGKIDEFNAECEDWMQYTERLTQYFIANKITDNDQRRVILLSVIGSKTYGLLRSLVTPDKPADKSYEDIVDLLKKHFNPKPSPIVQRCKSYSCERTDGQSVASYVA